MSLLRMHACMPAGRMPRQGTGLGCEAQHRDEGYQAVLAEAAGLAGATRHRCQQQVLPRPGVGHPLRPKRAASVSPRQLHAMLTCWKDAVGQPRVGHLLCDVWQVHSVIAFALKVHTQVAFEPAAGCSVRHLAEIYEARRLGISTHLRRCLVKTVRFARKTCNPEAKQEWRLRDEHRQKKCLDGQ